MACVRFRTRAQFFFAFTCWPTTVFLTPSVELVTNNNTVTLVRERSIRPNDCRLWPKLVTTFADTGCRVVSAADPYGRILGFLDRDRYFFFKVAPQFYSQGWLDSVPDPLFLRKSGNDGNRSRNLWICNQEPWPLDVRGELVPETVSSRENRPKQL
jgi:hypothetical protein